MSNSLIFFGKPHTYEAYLLAENTEGGYIYKKIGYPEPDIRPDNQSAVIRSHRIDGEYYFAIYKRASSYSVNERGELVGSGRPGIVAGVAIKSESAIEINSQNIEVLSIILDVFTNSALHQGTFKYKSWVDVLQNLNIRDLIPYLTHSFKYSVDTQKLAGESRLLYVDNVNQRIDAIVKDVNQFDNVYIADNAEIFESPTNKQTLYRYNNEFYTVKNNSIVKYDVATPPPTTPPPLPDSKDVKILKAKLSDEEAKNVMLEIKLKDFGRKAKRRTTALVVACTVLFVSTLAFFFQADWKSNTDVSKGNSTSGQEAQTSGDNIEGGKDSQTEGPGDSALHGADSTIIPYSKDNIEAFNKLVVNIRITKDPVKDTAKYENAIRRDLNTLGFDPRFAEILNNTINNNLEEQKNNRNKRTNVKNDSTKVATNGGNAGDGDTITKK